MSRATAPHGAVSQSGRPARKGEAAEVLVTGPRSFPIPSDRQLGGRKLSRLFVCSGPGTDTADGQRAWASASSHSGLAGGSGDTATVTDPPSADAVVFVHLVLGDLRLVDAQALGELALGQALRDPQRDQAQPDPFQVRQWPNLPLSGIVVPVQLAL